MFSSHTLQRRCYSSCFSIIVLMSQESFDSFRGEPSAVTVLFHGVVVVRAEYRNAFASLGEEPEGSVVRPTEAAGKVRELLGATEIVSANEIALMAIEELRKTLESFADRDASTPRLSWSITPSPVPPCLRVVTKSVTAQRLSELTDGQGSSVNPILSAQTAMSSRVFDDIQRYAAQWESDRSPQSRWSNLFSSVCLLPRANDLKSLVLHTSVPTDVCVLDEPTAALPKPLGSRRASVRNQHEDFPDHVPCSVWSLISFVRKHPVFFFLQHVFCGVITILPFTCSARDSVREGIVAGTTVLLLLNSLLQTAFLRHPDLFLMAFFTFEFWNEAVLILLATLCSLSTLFLSIHWLNATLLGVAWSLYFIQSVLLIDIDCRSRVIRSLFALHLGAVSLLFGLGILIARDDAPTIFVDDVSREFYRLHSMIGPVRFSSAIGALMGFVGVFLFSIRAFWVLTFAPQLDSPSCSRTRQDFVLIRIPVSLYEPFPSTDSDLYDITEERLYCHRKPPTKQLIESPDPDFSTEIRRPSETPKNVDARLATMKFQAAIRRLSDTGLLPPASSPRDRRSSVTFAASEPCGTSAEEANPIATPPHISDAEDA